ncbi:hypothetical protein AB0M28_13285 [Streptomyces sp. NPDC051940]
MTPDAARVLATALVPLAGHTDGAYVNFESAPGGVLRSRSPA